MANIAAVLKAEIARIARKELRTETEGLKKTAAHLRGEVVALKRELAAVKKELRQATKASSRARTVVERREPASGRFRFSAKGLASNRQRLGLSAEDFGLLVGASGQSVFHWEHGKSVPRAANVAAIATLRGLGKREALAKLAELKASR